MIIKSENMEQEIKEKMRGGEGNITIVHYAKGNNLKHSRLLAKIIIPEGAGIGEHEHINETEYYIILKGNGVVKDNGIDCNIKEGDCIITGNGEKHSIKNIGQGNLELIASIILD